LSLKWACPRVDSYPNCWWSRTSAPPRCSTSISCSG